MVRSGCVRILRCTTYLQRRLTRFLTDHTHTRTRTRTHTHTHTHTHTQTSGSNEPEREQREVKDCCNVTNEEGTARIKRRRGRGGRRGGREDR